MPSLIFPPPEAGSYYRFPPPEAGSYYRFPPPEAGSYYRFPPPEAGGYYRSPAGGGGYYRSPRRRRGERQAVEKVVILSQSADWRENPLSIQTGALENQNIFGSLCVYSGDCHTSLRAGSQ